MYILSNNSNMNKLEEDNDSQYNTSNSENVKNYLKKIIKNVYSLQNFKCY